MVLPSNQDQKREKRAQCEQMYGAAAKNSRDTVAQSGAIRDWERQHCLNKKVFLSYFFKKNNS